MTWEDAQLSLCIAATATRRPGKPGRLRWMPKVNAQDLKNVQPRAVYTLVLQRKQICFVKVFMHLYVVVVFFWWHESFVASSFI